MAPFGFPEAAFILEFGADVVYCILGHDTFDTFSELLAYWTHIEQNYGEYMSKRLNHLIIMLLDMLIQMYNI